MVDRIRRFVGGTSVMEWSLAVDFGTTFTTAAMVSGETVTIIELDGGPKIPSAVALDDEGELVVGLASGDEAGWAPSASSATQSVPWDGPSTSCSTAGRSRSRAPSGRSCAQWPTRACGAATGRPRGSSADHPVRWSSSRCAELAAAATAVGHPDPLLVPKPVAAAMHYLDERIDAATCRRLRPRRRHRRHRRPPATPEGFDLAGSRAATPTSAGSASTTCSTA